MAITMNRLTSNVSTTDATSYNTASITPTTGSVVFVMCSSRISSGTVNDIIVTGCGLTWTFVLKNGPGARQVQLAWGYAASPSTGAVNISFNGQTQSHIMYSVFELAGVDTSAPIVQTATGNGTDNSIEVTLGAFASADNGTICGAYTQNVATPTYTAGAGGWEIVHQQTQTENTGSFGNEWLATNDTSVTMSLSATPGSWYALAAEVKAAAAAANLRRYTMPLTGVG